MRSRLAINFVDPVNRQDSLANGLVGLWIAMDGLTEGSSWPDLMRNGHGTHTQSGSQLLFGADNYGKLAYFDGTGDVVALPRSVALDGSYAMSVFASVVPFTGTANKTRIIDCWNVGYTAGYALKGTTSGGDIHGFINATGQASGSGVLVANERSVFGMTWQDGGNIRLFKNGRMVTAGGTPTGPIGTTSNGPDIGLLRAAGIYASQAVYWVGLWRRALTDDEAMQLYADSNTGWPRLLRRVRQRSYEAAAAGHPAMRRHRMPIYGVEGIEIH